MSARRRSRTTRYLGEREIRGRVALDEAARAGRPEPHNRRRATLESVGDPEIDGRLGNQSVPTLPNVEGDLPQEKLPNVPDGRLSNNIPRKGGDGRISASDLNIPGLGNNPGNDEGKAVDLKAYKDFRAGLPDFGSFARQGDINQAVSNRTTAAQVKALIKKNVKKSAQA